MPPAMVSTRTHVDKARAWDMMAERRAKAVRFEAALRLALPILEAVAQGRSCQIAAADLAPTIDRLLNGDHGQQAPEGKA
jgi:hypothetical protein